MLPDPSSLHAPFPAQSVYTPIHEHSAHQVGLAWLIPLDYMSNARSRQVAVAVYAADVTEAEVWCLGDVGSLVLDQGIGAQLWREDCTRGFGSEVERNQDLPDSLHIEMLA